MVGAGSHDYGDGDWGCYWLGDDSRSGGGGGQQHQHLCGQQHWCGHHHPGFDRTVVLLFMCLLFQVRI